jgi:CheY-like chemotaxis protein
MRPAPQSQPPRILVCDDEPAVCDLVAFIGAGKGWDVAGCYTAQELEAVLARHHPNAALMDVHWGDTNGLTKISTLRRYRVQHVFALSGAVELQERAAAAGADGFIEKPFRLQAMEQLLDDLARRLREDEIARQ